MAKLIRCVPATRTTVTISCESCSHRHPCAVTENHPTGETCDVAGEPTDIDDIKKWKCHEWSLDQNINLNA